MQALQRVFQTISRQLKSLSAGSRLFIGSVMVILVMALFLVSLYSSRAELVPLPVSLTSTDSKASAITYLENRGIRWDDRGDQIAVPAEKRHIILAELTEKQIIAPDQIDFDALIQQDSPFLSRDQNDRRWLVATMNHLSRTISRMKGIRRADVVIDEPGRPGGIGRAHLAPSASVNIITDGGTLEQGQVNAIAAMVAGAHAELASASVAVIDASAGRVHHALSADDQGVGRYLDLQLKTTRVYEQKLQRALGYIPGVNVAVNVIVDHREVREETRRVDEAKQGLTRESSRTMNAATPLASSEAGVRPNTGASLASTGRRASTSADERSDTRMIPAFGGTDSRTVDPGGYALKINASIGVPRSYFVRLWRDVTGEADDAEPATDVLDTLVGQETQRIRTHVQPLVDTGPKGGPVQGAVAVMMIPDYAFPAVAADGGEAAGIGGTVSSPLSETLVRYGTLGGLALLSLFMMLMMVRKATRGEELPSAAELLGLTVDTNEPQLVPEAEFAGAPMEGVELDEPTLRRQQMLHQLNEVARAAPDEAVALLKRWVREEA